MKKIKLSVAALLIASGSFAQTQCTAITKQNAQCKNVIKYVEGNDQQQPLCYLHDPSYVKKFLFYVQKYDLITTNRFLNKKSLQEWPIFRIILTILIT